MNENEGYRTLQQALRVMGNRADQPGPKSMRNQIARAADDLEFEVDAETVLRSALSDDPNERFRLHIGDYIRAWDSVDQARWSDTSTPCSLERRALIYERLDFTKEERDTCDALFPRPEDIELPIIIAEEHEPWYTPDRRSERTFYWDEFTHHLRSVEKWKPESIIALDQATTQIVERISDPARPEIFSTKGLVVGYVQSGKTANFTGVIAKAADSGYRLIIILAGTLNILREQTQRRIDKELIGKEIIQADAEAAEHDYVGAKDWDEFISHDELPSKRGLFDWERFTGEKSDYRSLGKGFRALQHNPQIPGRRINDSANLHNLPVKLFVVKKNAAVLKKLCKDLRRLDTALDDVPTLIIDDESDQASIDTRQSEAKTRKSEEKSRSRVNGAIVELLGILKRSQYIGYTATPFANVFIDPTDAEDLFPKDYILALGRPHGYMGVRDFFDLSPDGRDLEEEEIPAGFASNERAFKRAIAGEDDEDGNLPAAIDSFVIGGAIKLFRQEEDPESRFKHHTMIVHRSARIADHEEDAELVDLLWQKAGYGKRHAYDRLRALWDDDFSSVSAEREPALARPESFEALKPYIDAAVSKIQAGGKPYLIINGDPKNVEDSPNFERDRVWKIMVGGTKLSRGYTVEGLTTSYYRRKVKNADTLMQMGRWFGFRRGYPDLVRFFVGVAEPDGKSKTFDLYEAFKSICQDEESFRQELKIYSSMTDPRITPRQIPPIVASHLLRPTSKNKMYNVEIAAQNFGGKWSEPVVLPTKAADVKHNANVIRNAIEKNAASMLTLEGVVAENSRSFDALVAQLDPASFRSLLELYRWDGKRRPLARQLDFLAGEGDRDPMIDHWILLLPQLKRPKFYWDSSLQLSAVERSRLDDRFKAFSEPRHRDIAEVIAGLAEGENVSADLKRLIRPRSGVALIYPAIEKGTKPRVDDDKVAQDADVSMGLAFLAPKNSIPGPPIGFRVVDKSRADSIVVDAR